jgi:SAM-dependent methyltransferase
MKAEVQVFFDKIADDYSRKFDPQNRFLNQFFDERFDATLDLIGIKIYKKSLLDIGAGTGGFFEFLIQKNEFPAYYFATDISTKMLAAGSIPIENQFVGSVGDLNFPQKKWDVITLLGVTSYFDENDLEQHFLFFEKNLNADGCVILSFTNRNSFDFWFRKAAKPFLKPFISSKKVIAAPFEIRAFSLQNLEKQMAGRFKIEATIWLNQTVWPFSRLFPKTSKWLAVLLFDKKNAHQKGFFKTWFSSDFLVKIQLIVPKMAIFAPNLD